MQSSLEVCIGRLFLTHPCDIMKHWTLKDRVGVVLLPVFVPCLWVRPGSGGGSVVGRGECVGHFGGEDSEWGRGGQVEVRAEQFSTVGVEVRRGGACGRGQRVGTGMVRSRKR